MPDSCIGWISLNDYKQYCQILCQRIGIEICDDDAKWIEVSRAAADNLSCAWGGGIHPSPFKIMAAFIIAITDSGLLPESLSVEKIEEHKLNVELSEYPKAFAAGVAFEMARDFLSGAKIGSSKALKPLDNRISISNHFHRDLLFTIALGVKVNSLSLILESCAYQTNPEAQNGDRV